jgi:hypothetical protein
MPVAESGAQRRPGDVLPSSLVPLGADAPFFDFSEIPMVEPVRGHDPRNPPFRPSDLGGFDEPNPAVLALKLQTHDARMSAIERCLTNYAKSGGAIGVVGQPGGPRFVRRR